MHKPTGTTQQQAGFWVFTKYSCEWTPDSEQQLQAWLTQNERNRVEYDRALKLWQNLDQLKSASFPARQTAQQIRIKRQQRKQSIRKAQQVGIISLIVLTTSLGWNEYLITDSYSTAIGERKTINLADGSKMLLNTDTHLSVKITENHRVINLEKGEIYLTVAHEMDRPFDVLTGSARVHDIGTSFNVYASPTLTQVTVTEGKVKVIPDPKLIQTGWLNHLLSRTAFWLHLNEIGKDNYNVTLKAGEQLSYDEQGELKTPTLANVQNVVAWREGRMVFELATLEEVLTQVQRYHPISFQYSNAALKQIPVSASFEIDNLLTILTTLQAALPIKTQQLQAGHIIISSSGKG